MPTVKQDVIELIKRLPDDVDVDEIMKELYYEYRTRLGIAEAAKLKYKARSVAEGLENHRE